MGILAAINSLNNGKGLRVLTKEGEIERRKLRRSKVDEEAIEKWLFDPSNEGRYFNFSKAVSMQEGR